MLHADNFTDSVWYPVQSPSALKPPCAIKISPNREGDRFGIRLHDSVKHGFSFSLEDGDILFDKHKPGTLSIPGSAEEQVLLPLIKDIAAKSYDPSLEQNIDFPYTYGKMGPCFDQLTLNFAVALLERRCRDKNSR